MNKANTIYRAIYVGLSLLAIALIIVSSTYNWNNRAICPTSSEVERLQVEATEASGQGFFADWANQKYENAKSCLQPDEDNEAVTNSIGISVIIAVFYGLLMFVVTLMRTKIKFNTNKKDYEHLESLTLWRFCKVSFWIIIPSSVILMVFIPIDSEYPLLGWGIALGLTSFPLYLLFKRLALYVAKGNS